MFSFFEKNKKLDNIIMSPVNGKCIELSEVPDKVFAEKIMGDGVAFILEDDKICSPCYGSIITIASTCHAVGIKSEDGVEILIHVGVNTVELNGEGFEVLVKMNQKVKLGTPLLKINRAFMQEKSINLTTPLVITNSSEYELEFKSVNQAVENGKSEIIKYIKKC
ncbi:MAG: system, glucose-specific component [Firmicutes bacterium]|nr:system, glucose-specific component [Bacillota bacterium]